MKTCKICKEKFEPTRQMQPTCENMDCMIKYSNKHLQKSRLSTKRDARRALKAFNDNDIKELKKKATTAFNAFIRKRDEKLPCISCGYEGSGRQWHAGHYKPAGGYSYLRYDEANVHKQCSICNNHLSGNLVPYRENLILKIGQAEVDRLELPNQIKRWEIIELREIITTYRLKIKNFDCTYKVKEG